MIAFSLIRETQISGVLRTEICKSNPAFGGTQGGGFHTRDSQNGPFIEHFERNASNRVADRQWDDKLESNPWKFKI